MLPSEIEVQTTENVYKINWIIESQTSKLIRRNETPSFMRQSITISSQS